MKVRKVTAEYKELNTLSKLVFIAKDVLSGKALKHKDGEIQVTSYKFVKKR
ncbi:hypothetical protein ACQV2T_04170 [Facklamia sp. P13069]|uniref:hypothetical protein n=1 Tax=Facklamia sp. P13069 TaxID=3421954 RepID=UPI003D173AE6